MLSIFPITFASPEYDEAVALRTEVLRKPLGLEFTVEQLSQEWSDTHLAAFNDAGRLIGILLLTPLSEKQVKMRQVAVAFALQGQGVGSALVQHSEAIAREAGFEKMVLHARQTAVPFYLSLGYQTVGDVFEEVGIPHFRMEKRI